MSDHAFGAYFPYLFPVFFAAMWLMVTTMLGTMSGWFELSRRFPDRPDEALLKLRGQSGAMGSLNVNMNGILSLDVCRSGLRVAIWRLFGPFSRPFFAPWSEIRVSRRDRFLWKTVELEFGAPPVGRLRLRAHVADRIALAAQGAWPEPGPFQRETAWQAFLDVAKEWLAVTIFAALFFSIAPRLLAPTSSAAPPIWLAIAFPAAAVGIISLFRFLVRVAR